MYPLKKTISIALGLLVLAGVAVVITTGTVGASPSLMPIAAAPPTPSIPVAVTNTPLSVTGNVSATINGTPTVNANLTGTANVNATIVNPATSPLLVRDIDAGRSPYEIRLTMTIDDGSTQSQTGFDVPSGKRLVIEHVSARVQGPAGEKYYAQLQTHVYENNPTALVNNLVLNYQGTFSGVDLFTASDSLKTYAEYSVPQTLFIVTRTDAIGSSFAEADISGYLVDQ
jgi:hypothetical protein